VLKNFLSRLPDAFRPVGATTRLNAPGSVIPLYVLPAASAKLRRAGHRRDVVRRDDSIRTVERVHLPAVAIFDSITRRVGAALGGDPNVGTPYTDTGEGAK